MNKLTQFRAFLRLSTVVCTAFVTLTAAAAPALGATAALLLP